MPEEVPQRFWEEMDIDIFRALSDGQKASIASLGCPITVSAGWPLGRGGDRADQLFIILEGKAELWAQSGIGPFTLRILGPGESFPLAALVGSGMLISSATATTDMQLLAVPHTMLLSLCKQDPELGMKLYRFVAEVLATRYRQTLQHLTTGAQRALKAADFWANM